jgi:uncharacterized membrane protein
MYHPYYHFSQWIVWNLFLAIIPLALSLWLFRRRDAQRTWGWWVGLLVFIAFLPNAPYLLTDIIHLVNAIRFGLSIWSIILVLLPLHTLAIATGFEAYVLCLINQESYLRRQGAGKWAVLAEIIVHALCAVGIYLGRFLRFNSWDFLTNPGTLLGATLNDLTGRFPLAVMVITFLILVILSWVMKQITLGLILRFRQFRRRWRSLRLRAPSPLNYGDHQGT